MKGLELAKAYYETYGRPMIEEQLISVNGILETARRKKLKPGDVVKIQGLGAWQVAAEGE